MVAHAEGMPKRLHYNLLEFKPKNLKNPILKFEYISLIFLIFLKFFINFKINKVMYSNYSIHFYKYLGFSRIPRMVAHAEGMPKRPLYNCLESKPKNLKNPILKFEYISLIFLIFLKFLINFKINKVMYSNFKNQKYKYLGFSRIPRMVAHAEGMPKKASL
jgi:hypothetical protein